MNWDQKNILIKIFLLSFGCLSVGLMPYYLIYHKSDDSQAARGLASVSILDIESREPTMEEARRMHAIQDYSAVCDILDKFLIQNPVDSLASEAYFLLAESQWQLNQYKQSLNTIARFWKQDLDNGSKWHGYSLLIKGKILEERDQKQQAIQLYQQVLSKFSDRGLVKEAEDILAEAQGLLIEVSL